MGAGRISSKTVVVLLSVLFLIATIAMWCMGGYVIATFKSLSYLTTGKYTFAPAGVMIFLGFVFLLGAVSGFCAISRESKACSVTFFLFVLLLFVLLITALSLAFVYKRDINSAVDAEAKKAMNEYSVSNSTQNQVNYWQRQFACCGSSGYESWFNTPWEKNGTHFVPTSCCIDPKNVTLCFDGDTDKMIGEKKHFIYTDGCVEKVQTFIKDNLYYLGAGAIAFLVLLIFGMIGSCYVLFTKRQESYFNMGS